MGRSFTWGSGCGLAAQDRDRKGSTHMALSLPVATGTAGTEWLFHGALGGQPIGWDPPYSSLSSVGPLLPGSFHCLSTTGKFRHVAPAVSPQVPATLDNPCSFMPSLQRCCRLPSESPHHFAKISPETGILALFCIDAFSFLWGHQSHAAMAPSQLVPHTYRPGTKLTEDLVCSF